jgi:nucleoside-diphosphate-sugar epimerase
VRSVKGLHYNTCLHSYKNQQKILLSGATGFLEAFLLSEILDQSSFHISCFVRETTETICIDRIIVNMKRYGLWKSKNSSCITVVVSDITQKNLGILSDTYEHLSTTIDIVFMNAAKVDFSASYDDHRRTNVEGTKEIIKFACTGKKNIYLQLHHLAFFFFPLAGTINKFKRNVCKETEFIDDPSIRWLQPE